MKRIVSVLIDRGDLAEAGGCWSRISPGRLYATFHPNSPVGISVCGICDRIVMRGMGRWWDIPGHFGTDLALQTAALLALSEQRAPELHIPHCPARYDDSEMCVPGCAASLPMRNAHNAVLADPGRDESIHDDGRPCWYIAGCCNLCGAWDPNRTKRRSPDYVAGGTGVREELTEAIPPAYTEFIGRAFLGQ